MTRQKVLVVFGTRPEAIKMAPVVQHLACRTDAVETEVCVTGQHREMLDQVLALFDIRPDFDLNLMQKNQTPSQVAGRVFLELDRVLGEVAPDWMLVQGDTTTVMAAAIAGHYHRVRVGHVEAGLRTYDRANPFPEEMNRVVADHASDLLFAPTARARDNLLREGIDRGHMCVTGNTAIDALQWIVQRPPSPEAQTVLDAVTAAAQGRPLVLVTAHRRENFGQPLQQICAALRALATRNDVHIVYPVHHNPNVAGPVSAALGHVAGITLLPPADYLTFVHLMQRSRLILTDSGGVQEEAPSLGVPVLVLRETTERPEAVAAGAARVVGADTERIVAEAERLLNDQAAYRAMARCVNPYGDGRAARRIADAIVLGHCEEWAL